MSGAGDLPNWLGVGFAIVGASFTLIVVAVGVTVWLMEARRKDRHWMVGELQKVEGSFDERLHEIDDHCRERIAGLKELIDIRGALALIDRKLDDHIIGPGKR